MAPEEEPAEKQPNGFRARFLKAQSAELAA